MDIDQFIDAAVAVAKELDAKNGLAYAVLTLDKEGHVNVSTRPTLTMSPTGVLAILDGWWLVYPTPSKLPALEGHCRFVPMYLGAIAAKLDVSQGTMWEISEERIGVEGLASGGSAQFDPHACPRSPPPR